MMPYNEEKLQQLSFLDFLKWMKEQAENLFHTPKSERAYDEGQLMVRLIERRYAFEKNSFDKYKLRTDNAHNIQTDGKILDKYDRSQSDKRKGAIITEFRKELTYDLHNAIFDIERPSK